MRRWAPLLALAMTALFAPDDAFASTTCEYEPSAEVLNVTVNSSSGSAELEIAGSEIRVRATGPIVACSGGTPTLANTTGINVFDTSAAGFANTSIQEPWKFGSLTTILAITEPETAKLQLGGGSSADHIVLGNSGIDLDGDGNADLKYFVTPPDEILASASGGEDRITARGGSGTGAPVSESRITFADGSDGSADTFEGGELEDRFAVDDGGDVLRGYGGNDLFEYFAGGGHTIEGGEGSDTLYVPFLQEPLSVDLEKEAPQATGYGQELLLGLENVIATTSSDKLFGNAAPNRLEALEGDDTVDGRGGDDTLTGASDEDTVTYFDAKGAVEVNLGAGTATGAAGKDSLQGFENLKGSPFADHLIGSEGPNRIEGRNGSDTIEARGGDDTIEARDETADHISCGPGKDTVVADRLSLDTVAADCENVDAPSEGGGGGGGSALDFRLSAPRKQRVLRQHGVRAKLRCPIELCSVRAKVIGKAPMLASKSVLKHVLAGPARNLKLPLGRHALAALQSALGKGHAPKLSIVATATAGGSTVRRTVTVKVRG